MLNGRTAIVTGAASGIGRAIAAALIEAGANVVLCDRNADTLPTVAEELGGVAKVADVSNEASVAAAMDAAIARFGSLDIVVNCAGFGRIAALTELSAEDWLAVQGVALSGVFYGVKQGAIRMLAAGKGGVILNISSINARQPGEGQIAYCSAKAGVDMVTRVAALELGPKGIRVVGIAPGLVDTPLTARELEDPVKGAMFLACVPLGRPAKPEEIGAVAAFLVSDDAAFINGDTLLVDGGSNTRFYPALLTGGKPAG